MINKKSTLALILGMIIMASSLASASYINDFGGARSASASSGATAGAVSKVSFTDDASANIDGIPYLDVLREWIQVSARVPAGVIGDASATVDTQGAKEFTERLTGAPIASNSYIKTSLDGKVEAAVAKTSSQGVASASAIMQAETGATYAGAIIGRSMGGAASLSTQISHTGVGTALAEADGDALYEGATDQNRVTYTTGYARGNVKLSGTNVKFGGKVDGSARIDSHSSLVGRVGRSVTTEELCLNAERDISFEGDSKVEGSVDGAESGETRNGDTIVDVETTSVMNGMARALHRNDAAHVSLLVNSRTGTNGREAISDNIVYGEAITTRDSTGSSTEKAQAEGFITDATWTASTVLREGDPNYRYASVQGKLGGTPDGMPQDLPGLGVGSWISNPYINPMTSIAYSVELAASGQVLPGTIPSTRTTTVGTQDGFIDPVAPHDLGNPAPTRINAAAYQMRLNGMVASGNTNDAVGAYLGLDTQILKNDIGNGVPVARAMQVGPMNGIEWLEGKNPNLLPGSYTPIVSMKPTSLGQLPLVPDGLSQDAISRSSGLRFDVMQF
jgi:hypothetical protein